MTNKRMGEILVEEIQGMMDEYMEKREKGQIERKKLMETVIAGVESLRRVTLDDEAGMESLKRMVVDERIGDREVQGCNS